MDTKLSKPKLEEALRLSEEALSKMNLVCNIYTSEFGEKYLLKEEFIDEKDEPVKVWGTIYDLIKRLKMDLSLCNLKPTHDIRTGSLQLDTGCD